MIVGHISCYYDSPYDIYMKQSNGNGIRIAKNKKKILTIRDRNLFAHGQDSVLGSCRVTENQICWKHLLGLGGRRYVY